MNNEQTPRAADPAQPALKLKLWTLHTRLRWGDSITELHTSRAAALHSAGALLEDEEKPEFDALVSGGDLDEADARLEELLESSGHEWAIESHELATDELRAAILKAEGKA